MTLAERAKDLAEKRSELAALFGKHKNEAGEYDMPAAVLDEVRSRNEELERLGSEFTDLKALDEAEQRNAEEMQRLAAPAPRVPHAGGLRNADFGLRNVPDGLPPTPQSAFRIPQSL